MSITSDLSRLVKLPTKIRQAGLTVPADIVDAVALSKRTPKLDLVRDSRDALFRAKTDKEWQAAAADLAQAMLIGTVATSPEYRSLIDEYRHITILSPVTDHLDALFAETCGRFNTLAPAFQALVERIPNLTEVKPMDLSPDAVQAITEAKAAMPALSSLWTLYGDLCRIDGQDFTKGTTYEGALDIAFRLGDYDTWDHANLASSLIVRQANGDTAVNDALGPISPFALVPWAGGRLELVTPDAADDRRGSTQFTED